MTQRKDNQPTSKETLDVRAPSRMRPTEILGTVTTMSLLWWSHTKNEAHMAVTETK